MKIFNAVCFCVLMDHHKAGVEEAHPAYIKEKMEIFEDCSEHGALTLLDAPNKQRALNWCRVWGVPVPEAEWASTASINPKAHKESNL